MAYNPVLCCFIWQSTHLFFYFACYNIQHMFFIRNKAITQAVRSSRNLFKPQEKKPHPQPEPQAQPQATPPPSKQTTQNTGFVMATEELCKPYPYKFGGVTSRRKSEPRIQSLLPSKLPNFYQIYIDFLKSIEKKNQKQLSLLTSPELVEPLLAKNVRLIKSSSRTIIEYNTFATGMGVLGKRDSNIRYRSMAPPNMPEFAQYCKVYMPQTPTGMFDFLGKANGVGFPILLSAEITIKSQTKLIPLDSAQQNRQESHVLTFEKESQLNITSAMQMLPGIRMSFQGVNSDKMKNLLYDSEGPWRIANIDNFFKNKWQ